MDRVISRRTLLATTALGCAGAGLGLAICKEIMEFLGGDITYLPGRGGACFRVSLPRRPPVLPENAPEAMR